MMILLKNLVYLKVLKKYKNFIWFINLKLALNLFFDYFSMNTLPPSLRENNNFLSNKIKQYIHEYINNFKRVTYIENENLIEMYKLNEFAMSELEEAKRIYKEVLTLSKTANTLTEKPIRCYIFLVNIPKELDYSKKNITSTECNSGCSTFYENYIEIVLWRSEEWKKVFYHELIHATYLDKDILGENTQKDLELKNIFPHYNDSIFEAYTEILATILYVKSISNSLSIYSLMKDQNIFLGTQVNKIIHYMNIKNASSKNGLFIEDFFRNPNIVLDKSTNTSSYYFLKSIYLWNCMYKDKTLCTLEKILDKEFINSYFYDIFINTLKTKEYYNWLNKIYFEPKNDSLRLTLE